MNTETELLEHLDQLHTTELGVGRIKKNLSLDTEDVVEWCREKINSKQAVITRNGKNWYIHADACIITVNAYSYTIITAHKEKIKDQKANRSGNNKNRYSIKMRASNKEEGHISGAEKIIPEEELEQYCSRLLVRALQHSKGKPDFINLKIEAVKEEEILRLPALPVTTVETASAGEGLAVVRNYLHKLGLKRSEEILSIWRQSYAMRGAMLLDADTLQRLEPDHARGIRATYMDMETSDPARQSACSGKNHFQEALVLATKVVSHPNIVAELCISDDPDYVTGYIASKEFGYVRITTLKEMGSPQGGRVFLFRGKEQECRECIEYLQQQKVLVYLNA